MQWSGSDHQASNNGKRRGSRLARRSELTVYSHGASTIGDEKECEICHVCIGSIIKKSFFIVNT